VKTELTKAAAAAMGLVVLAAAQDLAPAAFGAKPPFLLVFGCIAGIPAAIAAGLFADALSALPFGCSAVFFFAAAFAVRYLPAVAYPTTVAAAALYQLWLIAWGGDMPVSSFSIALAYAAILYPATRMAVHGAKRRAGIDNPGKEPAK
jgi:hypothetical protein